MNIQTAPSCEKCKFFVPEPSDFQKGRCRRFPRQRDVTLMPDALGNLNIIESADFPNAARNDWCGEFQQAQMAAAEGSA